MQDKQKVTLYLPPDLHRKLKIAAAVDAEPMSAIAQKAIGFYLDNPEVVDSMDGFHGHTHQVYSCPDCSSSYVIRDGELQPIAKQSAILDDAELPSHSVSSDTDYSGEQELVLSK
ncbi:MAG: hypothetical protein KME20_20555 [Kaiparowitsia implicata GSE-PSE-MK54-09C]|jgi:hypothetical protein|nr:hypothetical protein [Kaiparowitsia implicata GSE-PSE-MK54-09C]